MGAWGGRPCADDSLDRGEGMTSVDHGDPQPVMPGHQEPLEYTSEELGEMTPEELMIAGAANDGVYIVHRRNRFPIPGTKAEKRAERAVSAMFVLAALAGVGFIVAFIAMPY